jgi:hypothetical protein
MLILLAAAVSPAVVIAGQEIVYSLRQGYDDGYGSYLVPLLVFLVPAGLLAAQVVWASRRRGAPIVTGGVGVLVVAAACGFGLASASDSSTAGLVFIWVVPVQWAAAVLSGVGLLILNFASRVQDDQ